MRYWLDLLKRMIDQSAGPLRRLEKSVVISRLAVPVPVPIRSGSHRFQAVHRREYRMLSAIATSLVGTKSTTVKPR